MPMTVKLRPPNLLEQIGGLDVDVLLRRPQIGVGVDLQPPEPGAEEHGDGQDAKDDEHAVGDDPLRVGTEYTGLR
jgi:hypothetical protein